MSNETEKKTIEFILKLNDQMGKQLEITTQRMNAATLASNDLIDKSSKHQSVNKAHSTSLKVLAIELLATAGAFTVISKAISAYSSAGKMIVQTGGEFEQSLANTKAVLQPTALEFEALSMSAKELGRTTVFTASEAGNAFTELGKNGYDAGQVLAASNGVLNLAAATNIGMADAAMLASASMNQFNLSATDTNKIVDVTAKALSISALGVEDYSDAMKYCGTAANQAGESIEGTSAALAVLSNQNLKGSQAGTSLRRIFMVLNNEMSDASKIVREINPEAKTFAEKMQALHDAGLNSTSAMKLFRIEASSAAVILANNVSQLNDYGNKLEWTAGKSKGFAEQMAATQLDTFQGDLRLAKSALDDVAISLMQAFNTNARGAVQDIVDDLGDLSKWIEENPDKLREWGDTAYGIFKTAEQGAKLLLKTLELTNGALSTLSGATKVEFDPGNKLINATNKLAEYKKYVKDNPITDSSITWNSKKFIQEKRTSTESKLLSDALDAQDEITRLKESSEWTLMSDKDKKRMEEILKLSDEAIKKEKTYLAVKKESAAATGERLKQEAALKKGTGRASSGEAGDTIDVEAQKKAEDEFKKAQKQANENYDALLKEHQRIGWDSQKLELAKITDYYDDLIKKDIEGGSAHVAELRRWKEKAVNEFLTPDYEMAIDPLVYSGRGNAPTVSTEKYDGGEAAYTAGKYDTSGESSYGAGQSAASKNEENVLAYQETRKKEIENLTTTEYEKLTVQINAENERFAKIQDTDKQIEQETKLHNARIASYEKAQYEIRMQAYSTFAGGMGSLLTELAGDNKAMLIAGKALSVTQATIDGVVATQKALSAYPPPYNYIAAAGTAAYAAANVAQITGLSFAQGDMSTSAAYGLVPGSKYSGDTVLANVSSGERILNAAQNREYEKKTAYASSFTVNYSPTYSGNVSSSEKRKDLRNLEKKIISIQRRTGMKSVQGAYV